MICLSRLDQRKDNRMPITTDFLEALVQVLPSVCCSIYEANLFTAMFVTAFCGYLRIVKLVQNSITDIDSQYLISSAIINFNTFSWGFVKDMLNYVYCIH